MLVAVEVAHAQAVHLVIMVITSHTEDAVDTEQLMIVVLVKALSDSLIIPVD